ncbi:hypothetical protein [Aeromicrobium ginsengisoli]|uniref:Uncharacterized protein n=1 Tax=Aeromicrobium ginsengisoli TaxID=363867 RepID=A0A5M4FHR8_9ACTN|nr:hypothetical protein [Aeromicrobium ginsengisoli]KAA1399591.1 hypothetical protein ESP70_002160 [Aeromicrobium ginsengisoli]
MAETATTTPSYARTFFALVGVNVLTVVAAYALLINDEDIRSLVAAILLFGVIVAQAARCGPYAATLAWVATLPIAVAMAFLIAAHPRLDWSGPGEPDQITLTPLVPVIVGFYAIGFALIVTTAHLAYMAVRKPR